MKSVIIDGVEYIPKTKAPIEEDKKEWEIVAISENDRIYYSDSAVFSAAFKTSFKKTIISVLRLSDNEVFSVGDEICELGFNSDEIATIKSITIINNYPSLNFGNNGMRSLLSAKKHIRKPTPQEPKKEEVFTWTDELVNELMRQYYNLAYDGFKNNKDSGFGIIAKFKQSVQSKQSSAPTATNTKGYETGKERVAISDVEFANKGSMSGKGDIYYVYEFRTKPSLSKEQRSAIKSAIEKVLNDEPQIEVKYTQTDMDKAIEDAFLAGRSGITINDAFGKYYQTTKDYLNSLKNKGVN